MGAFSPRFALEVECSSAFSLPHVINFLTKPSTSLRVWARALFRGLSLRAARQCCLALLSLHSCAGCCRWCPPRRSACGSGGLSAAHPPRNASSSGLLGLGASDRASCASQRKPRRRSPRRRSPRRRQRPRRLRQLRSPRQLRPRPLPKLHRSSPLRYQRSQRPRRSCNLGGSVLGARARRDALARCTTRARRARNASQRIAWQQRHHGDACCVECSHAGVYWIVIGRRAFRRRCPPLMLANEAGRPKPRYAVYYRNRCREELCECRCVCVCVCVLVCVSLSGRQ